MNQQEAYVARLQAQMRAADARLDEMEASARAKNAQGEMNEISGLRARQDQIRRQVASAKTELQGDWDQLRRRVDANWTGLRQDVADRHSRVTAWDDARERRFVAQLDEAEGALRESAARDAESGANVRIGLGDAQQELREKAAAARQSYDAWRQQKRDKKLQKQLDQAQLELEEASYQVLV
ncbi:MAG TPA: hypothetical protein VFB61_01140 [Gemmatimonadales bacterium]|nr:hypothetical protein [Gemmatimonadales bacterium]